MIWKDRTSYSQSDKVRVPAVLELQWPGHHLVVHRLYGDVHGWYLTSNTLGITNSLLGDVELVTAQEFAINMARHAINYMMNTFNRATEQ